MAEFCERCGERFETLEDLITHAGKRTHEMSRGPDVARPRSPIGAHVLRSYDPTRG